MSAVPFTALEPAVFAGSDRRSLPTGTGRPRSPHPQNALGADGAGGFLPFMGRFVAPSERQALPDHALVVADDEEPAIRNVCEFSRGAQFVDASRGLLQRGGEIDRHNALFVTDRLASVLKVKVKARVQSSLQSNRPIL